MSHASILTDVTRCIGCESCVEGCRETNGTGEDRPWPWQASMRDLSATRWTTVDDLPGERFVRRQCRHCLDPACASACPVGALSQCDDGAVVYDSMKCMGCRYCMMACPFRIPRYSWNDAIPFVRKCILCHEKIARGEIDQPGCTKACPTGATIFGDREAMLAEAKRRIRQGAGRYMDHVYGEHEAGGTSVLTIADVPIPMPEPVPTDPLPKRTWQVLETVPYVFLGMGAAMIGLRWFFGRRSRLIAERAAKTRPPEAEEPSTEGEKEVEG